ncbi:polysaccharide deacetylase family protein [uncultured Croceitalea sp.]|uniref:polysaccharide deacetylase family protein n=1 Tax=uncultured Croceitalea sp. TaxID=1798908 RepID=UPI003306503D
MKHIFTQILGIEIGFTTKVEDFIKHTGPKITYTKQPLQNEFFIRSNDLLFEQGINDIIVQIGEWEDIPCFFETGERSNIPYDIFSASFYLLSRYEEYLPHVKDEVGRFPPKTSIAVQQDFLQLPVVDLWAHKFFRVLKERFPDIVNEKKKYHFTPIVNVTSSHCYALKGFSRNLAGFILDLGKFRFARIVKRIAVMINPDKDPYNNFGTLIAMHKKLRVKAMFFFQFAQYSAHDKNVSVHRNKFRYLIKSVADYSVVSLSASMASSSDLSTLKEEKKQLSNLINRPVKYSRLRYNKVVMPSTYRNLVDAEFTDDFTMGYTHHIGFRAGTCTPFYFYDINLEVQQPIKVHPFVACDYAFTKFKKPNEVFEKLDTVYRQVKSINGSFNIVFSNELFGEKHKLDWLELYESILKRYYV